ncbi:MAG: lysoplasmalogenase family protein, partial [Cytophagales bacterium]
GQTSDKSFFLVMLGALLFMVSDSLLAVNKFLNPFEFSGIAIMATYCAAQYLIVEGLLQHPQQR